MFIVAQAWQGVVGPQGWSRQANGPQAKEVRGAAGCLELEEEVRRQPDRGPPY